VGIKFSWGKISLLNTRKNKNTREKTFALIFVSPIIFGVYPVNYSILNEAHITYLTKQNP